MTEPAANQVFYRSPDPGEAMSRSVSSNAAEYGRVWLEPSTPIVAGSSGRWSFVYEVGARGIAAGGILTIRAPQVGTWRMPRFEWRFNQVTVHVDRVASNPLLIVGLNTGTRGQVDEILVTVHREGLRPDDRIRIVIGDVLPQSSYCLATAQWLVYPNVRFRSWVDPEGTGDRVELTESATVEVIPGPIDHLVAVARPAVHHGQQVRIDMRVEDRLTNIATDTRGAFVLSDGEAASVEQAAVVNGVGSISAIQPPTSVTRFKVSYGDRFETRTNPVVQNWIDAETSVYFGDLHGHCSDHHPTYQPAHGVGTPEEYYAFARNAAFLDFAALTEMGSIPWDRIVSAAESSNEPGKFVSLLGWEWSARRPGHRCVYYGEEIGSHFPVRDVGDKPEKLFAELRRQGIPAIVVPHHSNAASDHQADEIRSFRAYGDHYDYACQFRIGEAAWQPTDWSKHDPLLQRLVEIYQMRGSFERDAMGNEVILGGFASSVQDALVRGLRLGFLGSTDTHAGRPGVKDVFGVTGAREFRGGLTAVLATELSRRSLFEALWNRRCYAATDRILVDFRIDSMMMGQEISVDAARRSRPRQVSARVIGTANLETVTLVRNNVDLVSWHPGGCEFSIEWEDRDALDDIWHQPTEATEQLVWYYLRVTQVDRHMAWASPIWFSRGTVPHHN